MFCDYRRLRQGLIFYFVPRLILNVSSSLVRFCFVCCCCVVRWFQFWSFEANGFVRVASPIYLYILRRIIDTHNKTQMTTSIRIHGRHNLRNLMCHLSDFDLTSRLEIGSSFVFGGISSTHPGRQKPIIQFHLLSPSVDMALLLLCDAPLDFYRWGEHHQFLRCVFSLWTIWLWNLI